MDNNISLPQEIWAQLNSCWVVFFLLMGFLNVYVVYHYSTKTWVDFKLFGTLILTILFVIAQSFYMAKHVKK